MHNTACSTPFAVNFVVAIQVSQWSCICSLPSSLYTTLEIENKNVSRITTTFM